jgi:hypothetical protein
LGFRRNGCLTIVGHLVSQKSVQMFLHMNILNDIVAGLLKDDEVSLVDV